jgi:4-hydroxy-L-threonine phosphate dehydrogenase PdxA
MNFPSFILKKLKINLMLKNFNPIIVVAGEPKSVFLELFFKSFKKFKDIPIVLIASEKLLVDHLKLLKIKRPIRNLDSHKKINYKILDNKKINLINVPLKYNSLKSIKVTDSNLYINKCFDIAIGLLKKNNKLRLINGPIIKKDFLGKKHLGITEFLGSKFNVLSNVVMLIYNKNLSVSPLTTHIPLKNVYKYILKKKIINNVKIIHSFYKKKFNKNPSFAITGLNPHCESNSKLNEEDKIITPAINYLSKKKFNVSGPYPADTIFLKKNYKKFDVIIGMYHDQVLTPIKTIYEFDAINITLGLPFDRVSPDHGPNLSMLGKNKSNLTSLMRSIEFLSK